MANKYYQRHIERLQKEACERYQSFIEVEKEKKVSVLSGTQAEAT